MLVLERRVEIATNLQKLRDYSTGAKLVSMGFLRHYRIDGSFINKGYTIPCR